MDFFVKDRFYFASYCVHYISIISRIYLLYAFFSSSISSNPYHFFRFCVFAFRTILSNIFSERCACLPTLFCTLFSKFSLERLTNVPNSPNTGKLTGKYERTVEKGHNRTRCRKTGLNGSADGSSSPRV